MSIGIGIGIGIGGAGAGVLRGFIFTVQTDNAGVSNNDQFQLPLQNFGTVDIVVDWGDSTTDTITAFDQAEKTHTYPSAGTYEIKITGVLQGFRFNNGGDCLKMLDIKNYGVLDINKLEVFRGCVNLTQSATDAPIISTTDLTRTFSNCRVFNGDVTNWDVSNVTNFSGMFTDCWAFNQDITNWDVSSGTNFHDMFRFTRAFNQPIGVWDMSSATSLSSMFRGTSNPGFDQSLAGWDISNVTNFGAFFKTGTPLSTANYDATLISWASQNVQSNLSINFGNSQYTAGGAAEAARNTLINTYNWTITDGGTA